MNHLSVDKLEYRAASVDEIIQLRHDVLIVGTNRTSPKFDGDKDESTYHFGAFDKQTVYCCLSMMRYDVDDIPAYQLRGMATHPDHNGKGIGKRLLYAAEQYVLEKMGITYLWCNARVGFEKFYQKQGWKIISEPFMIENVCMHIKMEKQLDPSSS